MKRTTTVLLAVVVLAACTDRPHPTGIDPDDPQLAVENSTPSAGHLASLLIPVEDALSRVVDGMPHGQPNDELLASLTALSEALVAENGCAIRTSRKSAEHALRDLGRRAPEDYEADLEVVKLAIESVEPPGKGRCKD